MRSQFLPLLAACTTAAALIGQDTPLFGTPCWPLPSVGNDVAAGDIDGDGNLDVATVVASHDMRILYGYGNGSFDLQVGPGGTSGRNIAMVDLGGADTRPEIIVCRTTSITVIANTPGGLVFDTSLAVGAAQLEMPIATGDINGDGVADVVVGNNAGLVVFLGDGAGSLQAGISITESGYYTRGLAIADFDADGNLDIAFTRDGASDLLHVWFGDGTFTPQPASAPTGWGTWSEAHCSVTRIASGDFDNDGFADIATCQAGGCQANGFFSDGAGQTFNRVPNYLQTTDVTSCDRDGDGDDDLVYIGDGHRLFEVMSNAGGFLPATHTDIYAMRALTAADFDHDTIADIVVCTSEVVTVIPGRWNAALPAPRRHHAGMPNGVAGVAVGDLNGDGTPDLANVTGYNVFTSLGNGDGTFANWTAGPTVSTGVVGVLIEDLDGLGRPDLVVFHANGVVNVHLEQGFGLPSPTYGTALTRSCGGDCDEVFVVDLDNDGLKDLVSFHSPYSSSGIHVRVHLNDPSSAGSLITPPAAITYSFNVGGQASRCAAVADWDGDGDFDVAVGEYNKVHYLVNDGTGNLVQMSGAVISGVSNYFTIGAADMNDDGRTDLLAVGASSTVVALQPTGGLPVAGLVTHGTSGNVNYRARPMGVDIDGDGDLDLIARDENFGVMFVCRNDLTVSGTFLPPERYMTGSGYEFFDVIDIDGDGDLDVVAEVEDRVCISENTPKSALQWPGLGTDLRLGTGGLGYVSYGAGFDRKNLPTSGGLSFGVRSPTGELVGQPFLLFANLLPVGQNNPLGSMPIWLDTGNLVPIVAAPLGPFALAVGPNGTEWSMSVPAAVAGWTMVAQAVGFPASGIAISEAHVVTFF